jgi:hypothetical protein
MAQDVVGSYLLLHSPYTGLIKFDDLRPLSNEKMILNFIIQFTTPYLEWNLVKGRFFPPSTGGKGNKRPLFQCNMKSMLLPSSFECVFTHNCRHADTMLNMLDSSVTSKVVSLCSLQYFPFMEHNSFFKHTNKIAGENPLRYLLKRSQKNCTRNLQDLYRTRYKRFTRLKSRKITTGSQSRWRTELVVMKVPFGTTSVSNFLWFCYWFFCEVILWLKLILFDKFLESE